MLQRGAGQIWRTAVSSRNATADSRAKPISNRRAFQKPGGIPFSTFHTLLESVESGKNPPRGKSYGFGRLDNLLHIKSVGKANTLESISSKSMMQVKAISELVLA
jgi:hypothetical protein